MSKPPRAFPCHDNSTKYLGLTKREYIAARILPASYAHFAKLQHEAVASDKVNFVGWKDHAAAEAVRMADHLIAALQAIPVPPTDQD